MTQGLLLLLMLLEQRGPQSEVWPLPLRWACIPSGGTPTVLDARLSITLQGTGASSDVARAAAARYLPLLRAAGRPPNSTVDRVDISVSSTAAQALSRLTNYSYTMSRQLNGTTIVATAASPFGVAYALESLLQLTRDEAQRRCRSFSLIDAPRFAHRGLLLDTGRRFHPLPMLESLLESMAIVRLNVLHLYLSEECFRIESKLFPALTSSNCTVEPNFHYGDPGFYTHADVRRLVNFARLRGIRIVPEVCSRVPSTIATTVTTCCSV